MELTDESLMKFGIHKGKPLKDISRNYWIWLYDRKMLKGDLLKWALKAHPILGYGKKKGP